MCFEVRLSTLQLPCVLNRYHNVKLSVARVQSAWRAIGSKSMAAINISVTVLTIIFFAILIELQLFLGRKPKSGKG